MSYANRIKVLSMTVAALVGIATLVTTYAQPAWYNFGWKTPRAVDAAVGSVTANVVDFRTEYKCDKLKIEIKRVQTMDNTAPEKVPELMRLQKIYDDVGCLKYEF